ncbi:hypothetical protein [Paraburkholderia terrae]|uniref:hypothetical protein n=1 Tax=Paraburkholderia terrae TaxID=311230 RepID=UPI0012E09B51|nr:hypothetical protein [Paraburkholderia terrae]
MDDCEATLRKQFVVDQKFNLSDQMTILQYCFASSVRRGQMVDFSINRTVFAEQQYENHVLLWMVVAITLSGVGLAGIQLFAAYRLANSMAKVTLARDVKSISKDASSVDAAPKVPLAIQEPDLGGSIDFDKNGKLSFKSSVTGLLILILSFAFFLVFVDSIYTLKNRFVDPAECAANQTEAGLNVQRPSLSPPSQYNAAIGTSAPLRQIPMGVAASTVQGQARPKEVSSRAGSSDTIRPSEKPVTEHK